MKLGIRLLLKNKITIAVNDRILFQGLYEFHEEGLFICLLNTLKDWGRDLCLDIRVLMVPTLACSIFRFNTKKNCPILFERNFPAQEWYQWSVSEGFFTYSSGDRWAFRGKVWADLFCFLNLCLLARSLTTVDGD